MKNFSPKILVVGTGAIGSLYGAKLAQAGVEVSVLCRSDYEVVKKQGISVKSHWGDLHFTPKEVLREVSEYKEKADFILVATKVLPDVSVPYLIRPAMSQNTSVILIQNGIFIEKEIAEAFPNNNLISTIAFVDVVKDGAGSIIHAGDGRLTFGNYRNPNAEKIEKLIALCNKVEMPCKYVEDIQLERWKKLLWNASFNPISVIAGGLNTKEILDNILVKNLVRDVMYEVALLAKAQGYEISTDFIHDTISLTHTRKSPARTSMLLDFEAGRKMEVGAILGNVLEFAKEKSIATPYLSSLHALISCY